MKRKQALGGIRIIDFGWGLAAPMHVQWLADHGAKVVRLESHARMDVTRASRPYKDNMAHPDRSGFFTIANSSKYGATLDLSKRKGREIAYRFVRWADVMSISFTQPALERLGLDYESVSKIKPDIIYFSSSQQGHVGPHSGYRGYAGEAAAIAGIQYIIGWPERPPISPCIQYCDSTAPVMGVAAIMAALDYRRRTGKGQFLSESQVESAISGLATHLLNYQVSGQVVERNGNRSLSAAPHGVYPCKGNDRWCAITIFTDAEWKAFCEIINRPDLMSSPKFSTLMGRKDNEDELDRIVADWTLEHQAEEVMTLMQALGIPAGVVQNMEDVCNDPQLRSEGYLKPLEHKVIGQHLHPFEPFKLSKTPRCPFGSPCIGEHNEYVYKEILGMSDDEIAELIIDGVITTEADMGKLISSL